MVHTWKSVVCFACCRIAYWVTTPPPDATMNQRLALMSAILANPADDLPRLVFADWLEENGTTDADAARVELIRLGCKSKAKVRMSPAEGKWLDANWQRLLGNTLAARPAEVKLPKSEREGRHLRMRFRWTEGSKVFAAELAFEYVRGFARRVEYLQGHAYQRFWQATTTDEPLAYHRPELTPDLLFGYLHSAGYSQLFSTAWGQAVFDRVVGFDEQLTPRSKVFRNRPLRPEDKSGVHPLALADEPLFVTPQHRQRACVATAMTAIAREFVGLQPTPIDSGL